MAKNVFQRVEYKYLITPEQYEIISNYIKEKLEEDKYGKTTIQSLYFDTSNYRLIRESIEKPAFKEKLRLRSYGVLNADSKAFLEMKRKVNGVVYKRRIKTTQQEAFDFICDNNNCFDSQISKELEYFRDYYKDLKPRVLLIYDREAYQEGDLRVTFDSNIRYRLDDLDLSKNLNGEMLENGVIIMEIKTVNSMPLWLVELLSKYKIYKSSYSKYGKTYINKIHMGV